MPARACNNGITDLGDIPELKFRKQNLRYAENTTTIENESFNPVKGKCFIGIFFSL